MCPRASFPLSNELAAGRADLTGPLIHSGTCVVLHLISDVVMSEFFSQNCTCVYACALYAVIIDSDIPPSFARALLTLAKFSFPRGARMQISGCFELKGSFFA